MLGVVLNLYSHYFIQSEKNCYKLFEDKFVIELIKKYYCDSIFKAYECLTYLEYYIRNV